MDLSTQYLGLELSNPLVVSASPLSREVGTVRALEDAGVSAVVMYSLFQEQIEHDAAESEHYGDFGSESYAEASSFLPAQPDSPLGPEEYLNHLAALKQAVDIPIIASLNGSDDGDWTDYASKLEQAGADALELNTYFLATNPSMTSSVVEQRYLDVLCAVNGAVTIPVSMKLSPFISALAHFATRLEQEGADGLVLFNRFYQPDIDLERLEVDHALALSAPHEMRLPLRWIAILDPIVQCSLAASTGVFRYVDVLKLVMAGADVTMLCSAILQRGPSIVGDMIRGMTIWMEEHEYENIDQLRGSMSLSTSPDPAAFERANYMQMLNSYRRQL